MFKLIGNLIIKFKIRVASNNQYIKMLRKLGIKIGKGCEIYKTNVIWGSEPYLIEIGDYVRITSGVKFVTHDGGVWTLRKLGYGEEIDKFGKIKIGNNVHIGFDAIIMPGVTIGNNCVIGCGAVVTKNIPEGTVAVGVPARPIMSIEEYYKKNKDKFLMAKKLSYEEKRKYLKSYYE